MSDVPNPVHVCRVGLCQNTTLHAVLCPVYSVAKEFSPPTTAHDHETLHHTRTHNPRLVPGKARPYASYSYERINRRLSANETHTHTHTHTHVTKHMQSMLRYAIWPLSTNSKHVCTHYAHTLCATHTTARALSQFLLTLATSVYSSLVTHRSHTHTKEEVYHTFEAMVHRTQTVQTVRTCPCVCVWSTHAHVTVPCCPTHQPP